MEKKLRALLDKSVRNAMSDNRNNYSFLGGRSMTTEEILLEQEIARLMMEKSRAQRVREEREFITRTQDEINLLEASLASIDIEINKAKTAKDEKIKHKQSELSAKVALLQRDYEKQVEEINQQFTHTHAKLLDDSVEMKNRLKDLRLGHSTFSKKLQEAEKKTELSKSCSHGPMKVNVKMGSWPSGAHELYSFLGTNHAYMDFQVISESGPPQAKVWTCQLVIQVPSRPLTIRMMHTQLGNKKDIKNTMCGSILPLVKKWIQDLTICGDIEANPGPYPGGINECPPPRWLIQKHEWKKNYKERRYQHCLENFTKKHSDEDFEGERLKLFTETRFIETTEEKKNYVKYFRQQYDEKNKRLERDYRSKHSRFLKSPYKGDLKEDLPQFYDYLDKHGYASNQACKITPDFIKKIFEHWARCDKLIDSQTAQKICFRQKGVFFGSREIRPYYRCRKLLLKAFVADNRSPSCFLYLRQMLVKTYQMSNGIGVSLKEALQARDKARRKGINIDMSLARKQMHMGGYVKDESLVDASETPEVLPADIKKDGWFNGTIRTMGRKLGEGITDVVIPVLSKAGQAVKNALFNIPALNTIFLIVKIISLCVLVAILGWAIVTVAKTITMGITTFILPGDDPGDSEDMSKVKMQHFEFSTVKMIKDGWFETADNALKKFNSAFSDAELLKTVKKFGDFSAAVKNCSWLLDKIKEIITWIVNRVSSLICGKPFFQDAKNVYALKNKITELMAVVNIEDISSMTDPLKENFCKAYMDLVEMYPFVFRVDPALGAQINNTILKSSKLYQSCKFYLKTNVQRMEPYYVALDGLPGQGKTYLMGHLCKMIYDVIRIKSPRVWKELFYYGKEHSVDYSDTLVYDRKPEQEFWDGYNNQPICKMDDIGQTLIPEDRAAQFFSIIRMINNDPYPLHMADIIRKDSTVFKSFLLITSTNMNEKLFKLPGELGIVDPSAYLRRRDVSITVTRRKGHVMQGIQSKEYLDGYVLSVHFPDKQSGELGETLKIQGYDKILELVENIGTEIIARHSKFTSAQKMDHTGKFAEMEVDLHKVDLETIKPRMRDKAIDHNIDGMEDSSGSDEEIEQAPTTANSCTSSTSKMSDLQSVVVETDMSQVKHQMWSFATVGVFAHAYAPITKEIVYPLHPSAKAWLAHYCKNVETYAAAKIAVQDLKRHHACFDDEKWNHEYLINGYDWIPGIRSEGFKKIWKYTLGAYRLQSTKIVGDMCDDVVKEFGCAPSDVEPYIGLSNPLYYCSHIKIKQVYARYGVVPLFFDDVTEKVPKNEQLFDFEGYKELFLYETKHQQELRSSGGKSFIWLLIRPWLLILGAFAGIVFVVTAALSLYQYLDPRASYDMAFVSKQSSDPRLNQHQKRLARARALPKISMQGAARQYSDDNARSLLPIVRKNTYTIRAVKEGKEWGGYAVGICNSTFVVAAHLMETGADKFYLCAPGATQEFEFDKKVIKVQYVRPHKGLSTADLALVFFPLANHVKDIRHLLFKEDDELNNAMGIMREDEEEVEENGKIVIKHREHMSPDPIKVVRSDNYGEKGRTVEYIAKIKLNAPSYAGDCVRAYIFFNPAIQRKLGFFHIGQLYDYMLAGRLNQEDVEEFEKWLAINMTEPEKKVKTLEVTDECLILAKHQHKITFTPVQDERIFGIPVEGKLNVAFPSPGKTQIMASPMCRNNIIIDSDGNMIAKEPPFPVETAPAILRKINDKDPMEIGLQSLKNRKNIYAGHLQPRHYEGIFIPELKMCQARVLTLCEALRGIRNNPFSKGIKRATSMAFYHKLFAKLKREYVDLNKEEFSLRKNKHDFVHVGQDVYLHRDVLDIITMWFKGLLNGKVFRNWVIAMLKDETRPLDRVQACKTRVFYAGNFAFMIISRMVFGEFFTCLEGNWHNSDIAVGCNPYSGDWKWIFSKIIELGLEVKDDDTEKWDQNFPTSEFIMTFPDEYIRYFGIQDKIVSINLIDETIIIKHEILVYAVVISNFHCAVVIDKVVVFVVLQASGVDATTMFNSICNSAINRCIVERITEKPFKEVGRMWVYGDDLLLNCPSVPRHVLWMYALIMFNHRRTNPSKTENAADTTIDLSFFLQRQFYYRSGVIMCPLNIKSINNMIQWIDKPKKGTTFEQQFSTNCKIALKEISRHGPVLFEKYKYEMNLYLGQYGSSWIMHDTYADVNNENVLRAVMQF